MVPKHLCVVLLALIAVGCVSGQSEDIPIENDNQFPPENPPESELEGSGEGAAAVGEPPAEAAPAETAAAEAATAQTATPETTPVPQLEEMRPTEVAVPTEDQSCPQSCMCHYTGDSDFVVDCSGYELTQFPTPLDPKTTILNLQNNKLTEIPKDVSALKNLKILNAEQNLIMDLALGSVSELPELTVLKLANNRLIDYPKDLKNSLLLTKLKELDLGGNDMRSELKSELFSNFQTLNKLTLPVATTDLVQDLCQTLKSSLEAVCIESCNKRIVECSEAEPRVGEGYLDATLPGMIAFEGEQDIDPAIKSTNDGTEDTLSQQSAVSQSDTTAAPNLENEDNAILNSARSRIAEIPKENMPHMLNNIVEIPKEPATKSDSDVQVGAATTSTKTGGIDKSVIGMIVAGMVVIVAVITIKKNWGSIKKRFSSTPRPAERGGTNNANGNSPEEVPLQEKDKSPV